MLYLLMMFIFGSFSLLFNCQLMVFCVLFPERFLHIIPCTEAMETSSNPANLSHSSTSSTADAHTEASTPDKSEAAS